MAIKEKLQLSQMLFRRSVAVSAGGAYYQHRDKGAHPPDLPHGLHQGRHPAQSKSNS